MILATTVYTNTFLSLTPSSLNLKRKYRTKGLECHGSMSLAKCTVVVYALLYFDIQQAPRIIPPGFERGKLSTKVMTRAAVATACLADDEFGNRVNYNSEAPDNGLRPKLYTSPQKTCHINHP